MMDLLNRTKHVMPAARSTERTSLLMNNSTDGDSDDNAKYGAEIDGSHHSEAACGMKINAVRRESIAADRLSERLLAIDDGDDEMEDLILHETLDMEVSMQLVRISERGRPVMVTKNGNGLATKDIGGRFFSMTSLCALALSIICSALWISEEFIGPPNQPVGSYELIQRQVRNS